MGGAGVGEGAMGRGGMETTVLEQRFFKKESSVPIHRDPASSAIVHSPHLKYKRRTLAGEDMVELSAPGLSAYYKLSTPRQFEICPLFPSILLV